jgi:predicted esterase
MPSTTTLHHAGAPLAAAAVATLLIHGRGSSGDDIVGLSEALPTAGIAYLAPSAPGGAWYPQRFFVPLAQNEPDLSRALETIDGLVRELGQRGLPPERIALVGFSQGACLALEYAARHPRRYGLVAALSGALIGPLDRARPAVDLAGTPVLIGCAERDAHIPLPHVEASAAYFGQNGARVTKQIYPGSAHTVFPAEIDWLTTQLTERAKANSTTV